MSALVALQVAVINTEFPDFDIMAAFRVFNLAETDGSQNALVDFV